MMRLKLLPDDFPTRATHPLLRHELKRLHPARSRQQRLSRIVGPVIVLAILGLAGYFYATRGLSQPAGFNPVQGIWHTLFFPVLFVQWGISLLAIVMGVRVIQEERRRQTWDKLRSTSQGTRLTLETYRLTILYRLREGVGAVMLARLIFTGGMLVELMLNRGEYLDMLTGSSFPVVPVILGVPLMAAFICAGLLLPLVGVLLDISVALYLGTRFQNRTWAFLTQLIFIMLRLFPAFVLLVLMTDFLQAELLLTTTPAWGLTAAYSIFADHALLFLNSFQVAQIWQLIPYSIFMGLFLMLMVLVQAWLSDVFLRFAVRYAETQNA